GIPRCRSASGSGYTTRGAGRRMTFRGERMASLRGRTPFIGRAGELSRLTAALEATGRGQGGVLLLAGEAGIGKSRLVAETKARAVAQGALILQGNCFETDRALPYAPLLDLLRLFVAGRPPEEIVTRFGAGTPDILCL